jgi:hypothetical protein
MSANLEQAIIEKVHALPSLKQREILALIEAMLEPELNIQPVAITRPIGSIFEELSSQIPLIEWAELPKDGAEQHDHYLYGSPKQTTP